jgi:hypothetical protein
MPLSKITNLSITDDTIVNADIKTSAAIALSKLATDPSNASNLASGTVPTARLGSGTASSSTVLYGDQTYKAEPTGGLVLIEAQTNNDATGVASFDFENVFTSTYANYKIMGFFNTVGDNVAFKWRYLNDSTALTVAEYQMIAYGYAMDTSGNATSLQSNTQLATNQMGMAWYIDSNTNTRPVSFVMNFYDPLASVVTNKSFDTQMTWKGDNDYVYHINEGGSYASTASECNGITFYASSSNLRYAEIRVYGVAE